jgi:hypothetical protein
MLPPDFDRHWYDLEGSDKDTRRWSDGDATITLENNSSKPKSVHLTFSVDTLKQRELRVTNGKEIVYQGRLEPANSTPVNLAVPLPVGKTVLHFNTDVPAEAPGNGDTRRLAFSITNFQQVAD